MRCKTGDIHKRKKNTFSFFVELDFNLVINTKIESQLVVQLPA